MGPVILGGLAWSGFLVVISVLIRILYPLIRANLRWLHPAPRAAVLRGVLIAPLVGGCIGAALCFLPKSLGPLFPGLDHCSEHADGHAHFCFNHPAQLGPANELWFGLALVCLTALTAILLQWLRLRESRRMLRQLERTSCLDPRYQARVIESELPVAISIGGLRPRTLLSSGLLSMVPPRLLDAIVAHERAHGLRRDSLWNLATETLSIGQLPKTRRDLRRDLVLACEQACDEQAGEALSNRIQIAEALVAMASLRHNPAHFGPAALAFEAQDLTARVESLLEDSAGTRPGRTTKFGVTALFCAVCMLVADPLHHVTETLIHRILG